MSVAKTHYLNVNGPQEDRMDVTRAARSRGVGNWTGEGGDSEQSCKKENRMGR